MAWVVVRFGGRLVAVLRVMVGAVPSMVWWSVLSPGPVVTFAVGRSARCGLGGRWRAHRGRVGVVSRVASWGPGMTRAAPSLSLGATARAGGSTDRSGSDHGEGRRVADGRSRRGGSARRRQTCGTCWNRRRAGVLGIDHLVEHGCDAAAGTSRSDAADKDAGEQCSGRRKHTGHNHGRPRRRDFETTIDRARQFAGPVSHPGGGSLKVPEVPARARRAVSDTSLPPRAWRAHAHRNRLPARHAPSGVRRPSRKTLVATPKHRPRGMEEHERSGTNRLRTAMAHTPLGPNLITTGHAA